MLTHTNMDADQERLAILRAAQRAADAGHRVDDLPIGRTQVYKLIGEGKLIAKKMGRATIITNWPEYVASLPPLPAKIAA